MSQTIRHLAIVGAGLSGWTTAVFLARALAPLDICISLVELPASGQDDSDCEFWLPGSLDFLTYLGIEPQQLEQLGSSYSLAHHYKAWCNPAQDDYLSYCEHGFMLKGMSFSQFWLSRYHKGEPLSYESFSLSATAARHNRFRPAAQESNSLYAKLCYGLQVDNAGYLSLLQAQAPVLGINFVRAQVQQVLLNPDTGHIASLKLDAPAPHSELVADLYLDCSGREALLIEKTLGVGYHSADAQLPVNSLASLTLDSSALSASVQRQPDTYGWRSQLQTRKHLQIDYHFHTAFADNEAIFASFAQHPSAKDQLHFRSLNPGWRQEFWRNNCIALGESAAYADVLMASSAQLLHSSLLRLLGLFPATSSHRAQAREYNRLTQQELDNIVDFHRLHYHLCSHENSAYWSSASATGNSERLKHRLELFQHRGVIPFFEGETFAEAMWAGLLLSHHIYPHHCHPGVSYLPDQWIAQQLDKMHQMIGNAAADMPVIAEYFQRGSESSFFHR